MILFVSGRCDIPAFYSKWFFNRLKIGFVDVRNPYDQHQISRILLDEKHIDCIVFCTKNPLPLLQKLDAIPFPFLVHVTLTPYHQDIEPFVPDKKQILSAIRTLSEKLGKKRVIVRYDPILLTERYTLAYHKKAFASLCEKLSGYVDTIIISFVDDYRNMRSHAIQIKMYAPKEAACRELAKAFYDSAAKHQIRVQTCAENMDLRDYGIENRPCFAEADLNDRLHTAIHFQKGKSVRKNCSCLPTVDIGDYNACSYRCRYCYANYDESKIAENTHRHDPNSSVLIGHVEKEDKVTIRK